MTRSIFDPSNPNVERSGDRYTGPDARSISKMPEDVIDGVVEGADTGPDQVGFNAAGEPVPQADDSAVSAAPETPETRWPGEGANA